MPAPARTTLPCHVWVRDGNTDYPGVLVRWENRGGTWWGLVAWAPDGEPVAALLRADWLRPTTA